ncbi:MAG: cytochrome c oxidase subunit 3 family protein [Gammaproteobacteria bacterium]|jgi:nitric oxide reductase NorE protein|nr:cytochrome c oxidase subunit 3 family protein [Gammaproteobacteria bacterium]MBT3490000.1 cytochrome c oxidase subunit 3 family protein [Gammaproteobacteria bacterium]MBT3717459.1 cytochrome c oxidase subunit 3 family protein [Gammaproteobacteria bacterium]MBT3844317.1 cytochrome c oxidase subunit 3 family protein [Gammaproteobacteria bacterium]MBT3893731.1 cytochrome c oxidase subunit 3 family protein [Gammaproteobacteria bacterium]
MTQTIKKILPGDFAIWIFIYAELLVFGIFFISYAVTRSNNIELFNESQLLLDRTAGMANTVVLITSSWFVVNAVHAIKAGKEALCARWLSGAILLGGLFVMIKLFEFYSKSVEGITLSTNAFYMFYLSLTFFHFLHVILGMVILSVVLFNTRKGSYNGEEYTGVETAASYWHMVDLVWIVLFPLVYLLR